MISAAPRTYRGMSDPEGRTIRRLYWWAFLVRVLVGLLAYTLTLYADLPIVEDAQFYEEMGHDVAQDWLSGKAVDFDALPEGVQTARLLVTAIAAFYFLLGGVRALPVLLVAYSAVTALVPVYVYWFTRALDAPDGVARRAGCVVALWGVRSYLAILLALAVVLSLLWGRMPRTGQSRGVPVFVRQAAVMSVFAGVIVSVGLSVRTEQVLLESDEGVLVNLDVRRAGSAKEAKSGYLQEASVATPEEALQYFPVGLLYFLTVPFPWQLGAIRQNLIIPENTFWLGLYPLMVVGVRRALKTNGPGTVFLLLMTAGMCVIYALLAANVGTAYRMRSQVWLLWAPFAAWGWEVWRERRRPARRARLARGGSRALGAGWR